MTTQQTEAAIAVMTAYCAGKQIQSRPRKPLIHESGKWQDVRHSSGVTPIWDWSECEYRVAPEPTKPKRTDWWVVIDDEGDIGAITDTKEEAEKELTDWWSPPAYYIAHVQLVPEAPVKHDYKVGDWVQVVGQGSNGEARYENIGWDNLAMNPMVGKVYQIERLGNQSSNYDLEHAVRLSGWWFHKDDIIPCCAP
jgi:hypothetical protein